MVKHNLPLVVLTALAIFSSCNKENTRLTIPTNYDGSAFTANTATETQLRTALTNLSNEMKKGRSPGVTVDFNALTQLFQAGTPSLASTTTDYYKNRIAGSGAWLEELSKASGGIYSPGPPQGQGGVFVSNLFDENGLELEQLVEKGLFGAALFHHAATLLQGTPTPAVADQVLCIFGAHPDFPNTDNAANAANPDKFLAAYAARRDKNDGTGLYTTMKNALLKFQAATKAGADFQTEQLEAATDIRQTWEKINFATVINYCHAAISKLSATNPTDADKASALHAYAEAVGFVHGWRALPTASRIITDDQIDELLLLLNAPHNAVPSAYLFATDPVNELPKLTQVIEKLKTIYGFTDQEIVDFKENWVAKQGR